MGPIHAPFDDIGFKPVLQLCIPYVYPHILNVDRHWNIEGFSINQESRHPNWSGYMQLNTYGNNFSKATISFLPIIDLNPSSYTCVYSTLMYVVEQCNKFKIHTPSITFDQPLWLKATEISIDQSLDVVVHLGGFHTLMSFMGSIGAMMDGSGISSVLETIYGENSVKHILSGKAISRAIRGHLLVASALFKKLTELIFSEESSSEFPTMTSFDLEEIQDLEVCDDKFEEADIVKKFSDCMNQLKLYLCAKSRTSKLWLQYMDYVEIMRQFICAA